MREIRTSGSMSGDGKRSGDLASTRAHPRLYYRTLVGIEVSPADDPSLNSPNGRRSGGYGFGARPPVAGRVG